ncbi:hypothetical protein MKW92_035244 [Papaver armeniacum]|nr:hypothetical protein MKW92_035244 [Papaver armeniacum]
MGLSLSLLLSAWKEIIVNRGMVGITDNGEEVIIIVRNVSFKKKDNSESESLSDNGSDTKMVMEESTGFKNWERTKLTLKTVFSFKNPFIDNNDSYYSSFTSRNKDGAASVDKKAKSPSFRTRTAVKLQKVYKSYRTRRNLADCAVLVEELWWKALDSAALKLSSETFFDVEKHETASSRWTRTLTRAAKVGKGLSKDEKAQKLALQHWLEAVNGKEVNLERCPRSTLQRQCIEYLGPKEREIYEVIVEDGKLVYKQGGECVDTVGFKWIFFSICGATTAAGRLVAHDGFLRAILAIQRQYLPTEENFKEFIMTDIIHILSSQRCANDEDCPSSLKLIYSGEVIDNTGAPKEETDGKAQPQKFDLAKRLSCKWSTGTGPRIGCVSDYPTELRFRALEHVNLSPRVRTGSVGYSGPIPSPRPSPKIRLSPRLAYMGLPSPRSSVPSRTASC